jgi:hypothetical protein
MKILNLNYNLLFKIAEKDGTSRKHHQNLLIVNIWQKLKKNIGNKNSKFLKT